ncbi:hypothetical protein QFC24_003897 [Naganishia onofrii]|jgi:hypothetical protein|uniref:Uncharacterized protein n=1 Tax=Naganishia onofrii TaxID=1851511 RepID=A0ACC2XFN7_9TREE|nr:hypothetical protein QFC24_003897 [Naganishia onofrii]
MFATNFTVQEDSIRYTRGSDNLTTWGQNETPVTGGTMTNAFCKTCGTLMWRQGSSFPGTKFMRVGTVDDLHLHETVLRPQKEYFIENRPDWWHGVEHAKQIVGFFE